MGTHCYIAKEQDGGMYRSIFCQLDGFPEVTGALLAKNYSTPEALDALLSLEDIYCLKEKLEPDPSMPHKYGVGFQNGVTVAFGRDNNQPGFDAKDRTLDEMMDDDESIEFIFVFTADQEWEFCCTLDYDVEFRRVQDVLEQEAAPNLDSASQILEM